MRAFPTTLFPSFLSSLKIIAKSKGLRQKLHRASEGLFIPKSLCSTFLSRVKLMLSVLEIVSEQHGCDTYLRSRNHFRMVSIHKV